MGLLYQPVQTAGAIQQRILRMQMEVDKVRMRHETNVMRGREAAQVNSTKESPALADARTILNVAADMRRLIFLNPLKSEPPHVGCYLFLNPPGRLAAKRRFI